LWELNEKSQEQFEVRLDRVHKSFLDGREKVLRGVTLDFPREKLTYILGSSGAGKSVLLKHILGLLRPDQGEVWVSGQNVSQLRGEVLTRFRLRFGMLFQNSALFDEMTVFENVAFPLVEHTSFSVAKIKALVHKTLSLLGMKDGYHKFPSELSGGMRKRVGLARAIIREPSILLYDEPTTGLDPVTRKTVDELIETLKRELKLTSIVISHDIPSALLLADHIAFLDQGKIIFSGNPREFRLSTHPVIQSFVNAERRVLKVFPTKEFE
jgi:phospholipid/cholesterol/gamma-HCH transport system ATP-binding protein